MEENRRKYMLLYDRVESGIFQHSPTPIQVLRGELLEALPEGDQPTDPHQVALAGIERKSLRLHCPTSDLARLTNDETNLLLAVTSADERLQIYHERNRLDAGRRLKEGSRVLVKVKGLSKDIPGIVWYKGPIEIDSGTMFGVELTMDVYSFGTLLCEMCIRQLPSTSPQARHEQIDRVSNTALRSLVTQCVQTDTEMRPDMAHVLTSLTSLTSSTAL